MFSSFKWATPCWWDSKRTKQLSTVATCRDEVSQNSFFTHYYFYMLQLVFITANSAKMRMITTNSADSLYTSLPRLKFLGLPFQVEPDVFLGSVRGGVGWVDLTFFVVPGSGVGRGEGVDDCRLPQICCLHILYTWYLGCWRSGNCYFDKSSKENMKK